MADEVAISRGVNQRLTNLVVTREKDSDRPSARQLIVHAEWKIPGWMKDVTNPARATWVDASIDFLCSPDSSPSRTEVWQTPFHSDSKPMETTLNADHYWVRGLEQGGDITDTSNMGTELEKPYDRKRYYPCTSKKCTGVKIGVHGGNGHGADKYGDLSEGVWGRGPTVYQTFGFTVPQKPAVTIEWDEDSNYRAAYTVDPNPADEDVDKNHAERYDTRYRIMRQDNLPNSGYAKRKAVKDWTATTAESVDTVIGTYNGIRSLADGQWVEYTVEAYSRGMAGDGATATAKLVASRPAKATITKVSVSSMDLVSGVVTVKVTIPNDEHRWTTQAKLQRLVDVDHTLTAKQVAALDGWEDVSGMVQIDERYKMAQWDSGFTDMLSNAYPTSTNKKTWYRVLTSNELYYGDNSYQSTPVEATQLYRRQTATNDRVFVEKLSTNADATAVKVLLGWANDDSTGTEVSWSVHEDAWESSEQPSTALVTWKDATSQGTHANSASFTIYGVEPGEEVYVKARRYYEDDDGNIVDYSAYATASTDLWPYVPATPPREVSLIAPDFVARGADVPLAWTFQSDAPQTAWAVYLVDGDTRTAVASGEDAYGACTVPANMLSGDSATFEVSMTTGSEWATSDSAEVRFADPPTITATFPTATDPDYSTTWPLLLEQPMQLMCSSDTGDDLLHVRVLSEGVSYGLPDRDSVQTPGEAVFDAWVAPTWLSDGDGWYTAVTLPEDVDFKDVGVYTWEVTAQNVESGLLSETATGRVKVRWAHQAHMPGETTATVLADGRTVTLAPASPDNLADSDVFDLYRVTPDGADLIAEGLRYGSSVTDRFAPFGDASYRVCTRTVDGDLAWRDVDYTLKCGNLRIDWDGKYVELPYNVVRQDSWAKDFEARGHLDGSVGGGWNPAVTRSASLSTDMIRISSADDQRLVRELASYAGPAFVRLPNGSAYEADVQVSGLDESYQSGAIAVSLSATQVDLTDAYRIALSDVDSSGASEYDKAEYGMSQVLYWGKVSPKQGDAYTLMQEPTGDVLVELTASHDFYSDTWSVPNTVSGATVTLGTLSSDMQAFIADALAEDGSVRLIARYDTEAQDA